MARRKRRSARRMPGQAPDWSAEPAEGLTPADLDPVEVARLRATVRTGARTGLADRDDEALLRTLGAITEVGVTRAAALLVGRSDILARAIPQHEVVYLYEPSDTEIAFREDLKAPLLYVLQRLHDLAQHPQRNPVETVRLGLRHVGVPAFPEEAFREAVLNAVIHRDYLEPGSVYVHHRPREMVISNPGGFVGGITPANILHHEPVARNRLLAEICQAAGLVERAGIGRRRIFIPCLTYGKRPPLYTADRHSVTLTLFDGSLDIGLARWIAEQQQRGRTFDLVALLILTHLKEHAEIDVGEAAEVCQLNRRVMRDRLERLTLEKAAWLERRGTGRSVTYRLSHAAATTLIGKKAFVIVRGIDRVRWPELVRTFVEQHGSINNAQCRELLGLGASRSARVRASQLLRRWSDPTGFLVRRGTGPRSFAYVLRESTSPAT